jgi:hypothetical protein
MTRAKPAPSVPLHLGGNLRLDDCSLVLVIIGTLLAHLDIRLNDETSFQAPSRAGTGASGYDRKRRAPLGFERRAGGFSE